jgi:S-DNA-T family DNA segregation ATPase FtsK/SpoIIIE
MAPTFDNSSQYADNIEPGGIVNTQTKKEAAPTIAITAATSKAQPTTHMDAIPSTELLKSPNNQNIKVDSSATLQQNAQQLLQVLGEFGVKGQIIDIAQGPVVTLYEFEPAAGTKSSRIIGLADDIARSLSAISTRIAVVPGRNVLGIELPNKQRAFFCLKELIETPEYNDPSLLLPLILGKDLAGKPYVADLAKMPHLLVAGTTGSGKSVAINTMIMSLLYKYTPEECKLIMIDPKMLELSAYDGIPHLLTPVVTEPGKAVVALKWAVKEMENRYRLMSTLSVRNIAGYNAKILEAAKSGKSLERTVQTGFDPETGKPIYESVPIDMEKLPYIVVIVDEMADLMLVAGKDIESSIQRLAQMARAAGIHIIMATQRPSVDVITGVIKANFPSRVSFRVTSKIDSRTILGEQGAEALLGMGDMLYMGNTSKITRVHGPFVDDSEVEKVTQYLRLTGVPEYISAVTESSEEDDDIQENLGDDTDDETIYKKAVQIVKTERKVSISYIQRCLRIGYNRAATTVDRMEREGIISPASSTGKREIFLPED